jgi:hypothetical protein
VLTTKNVSMKKNSIILVLILIIWSGCSQPDRFDVWTVKEGQHHFTGKKRALNYRTQCARCILEANLAYEEIPGVNKLFGFPDALHHHTHSVRAGWRWNESTGRFNIIPYLYRNSKREIHEPIGSVLPGEEFLICVGIKDNQYIVSFNDNLFSTERTGNFAGLYVNWPYFGGQLPAKQAGTLKIAFL